MWAWFSVFLENAAVRRADRRMDMRMARFCGSAWGVLTWAVAGLPSTRRSDALAGTVVVEGAGGGAVTLDQHRAVDGHAERVLDGIQAGAMAVRGELHPIGEAGRHVLHELVGVPRT